MPLSTIFQLYRGGLSGKEENKDFEWVIKASSTGIKLTGQYSSVYNILVINYVIQFDCYIH